MSSPAPLGPLHHVGYVVADLDAGIAAVGRTFAVTVTHREMMEAQGVEAVMLEGAGGAVELIRPLDPEGAIARFITRDASIVSITMATAVSAVARVTVVPEMAKSSIWRLSPIVAKILRSVSMPLQAGTTPPEDRNCR